jgi:LmbE family N-acetylglucosaminyl deacetylase
LKLHNFKSISAQVAVIVAHPDDETLWAGGTILTHPGWHWFIACLCRAGDGDRAPKFRHVLRLLNASGDMGDLDDGPEQRPLQGCQVEQAILALLPDRHYDLIITHNPTGEYTRHLRHEEAGAAVIRLWHEGRISATELWTFACDDGEKKYPPRPVETADSYLTLPADIWQKKYNIITETYGFRKDSFEATAATHAEAFWLFNKTTDAMQWLNNGGRKNESTGVI